MRDMPINSAVERISPSPNEHMDLDVAALSEAPSYITTGSVEIKANETPNSQESPVPYADAVISSATSSRTISLKVVPNQVMEKIKNTAVSAQGGRAVYLFAGPKRRSEIGVLLKKAGWIVQEVDILRGGKNHDLTRQTVQKTLLQQIANGSFNLMLLSPPCDSFTRVKFANDWGPRPVRSMEWPNGFPYLTAAEKRTVWLADILVDFSCTAMETMLGIENTMLVLEFPEDLGVVKTGRWAGTRPASIFQLPRIRAICRYPGVTTGAILQSDYGMPYVKPTRLIYRLGGQLIRNFYVGEAQFAGDGSYLGPAPKVSTGQGLAKTSRGTGFLTTGTAAWPTQLCKELVRAANAGLVNMGPLGNGKQQGSLMHITTEQTPPNNNSHREKFPIESPPENYWIGGDGPPRMTKAFGKEEQFFDGCGLTSPGRWPRDKRRFPEGRCWDNLRQKLEDVMGNDETVLLKQFAALACHREDLFCKRWISETREILHQWLGRQCGDYDATVPPVQQEGQPFYLSIIHGLLREARDADYTLFSYLGDGVTLGVDRPLPHVPALFELQTSWRLSDDHILQAALENSNYTSVAEHILEVQRQFEEEEAMGWMRRMSEEEFATTYKGRYAISALAVLQEKDKIRILHDGSNGTMVNHRIRCRDRQRMPTLKEKRVILNEYRQNQAIAVSILADASKAHRRIKIDPAEWGYQACRLVEGTVWLNCVGTFGMASASYWWGRVGGGVIRCAYLLNGHQRPFDCLLFADDTEFLAMNKAERKSVLRAIVTMWALGWPFKWAKFRGGHEVEWVGYAVHYREYKVGISANRAAWVIGWIDKLLKERRVIATEMRCGLGRLSFVAQALHYEKPLLGVVYSWVATICSTGIITADIPLAVQLILHWVRERLREEGGRLQLVLPDRVLNDRGDWFRTDARVEGNRAYIGGWELVDEQGKAHTAATARWFGGEIQQEEAPWIWAKKGDAQRVIAALELLASLLALILFDPERKRVGATSCSIAGSTDNKGNSYIVRRMLSTKWPIMPLLIELSEQLRAREAELYLSWIPRDLNQEADDLSNLKFDVFDKDKRILFDMAGIPFIVFNSLIGVTGSMYADIVKQREEARARKRPFAGVGKLRGSKKLKWTSPW